jgi:hypothetical protein
MEGSVTDMSEPDARGQRSTSRKIGDVLHYPLSAIEGKHSRGRSLSAFRIIDVGAFVLFCENWPETFGPWDFAALTVIVLALPVADLFAAVPGKEALQALTAIFGGMISRRTTHTESESTYTMEDK